MGMWVKRVSKPIDGWHATDGKWGGFAKTGKDAVEGVIATRKLAAKWGGEFPEFENNGKGK